jgi:predicted membrane chloride channel (bestrophin family)
MSYQTTDMMVRVQYSMLSIDTVLTIVANPFSDRDNDQTLDK